MAHHKFCTIHRIGYDSRSDYVCPQCSLARIPPGEQLDFDVVKQKPVDAAGATLDPITLKPVA